METAYMVAVGVGGVVTGIGAYFGKKNLDQANVLKNAVPFSRLQQNVGRCVAVRGQPKPLGEAPYLWCKRTFQHYHHDHHRDGRSHGGWKTDSVQEDQRPFLLEGDGGAIEVHDRPNEVYGTTTHYEGCSGGGFFSHGETRVIVETLPVMRTLTVCGHLSHRGQGFSIRRDPALGLLFSPNDSSKQATHEAIKGYLGVLAMPLVWLLGSLFSYRYFHPR